MFFYFEHFKEIKFIVNILILLLQCEYYIWRKCLLQTLTKLKKKETMGQIFILCSEIMPHDRERKFKNQLSQKKCRHSSNHNLLVPCFKIFWWTTKLKCLCCVVIFHEIKFDDGNQHIKLKLTVYGSVKYTCPFWFINLLFFWKENKLNLKINFNWLSLVFNSLH